MIYAHLWDRDTLDTHFTLMKFPLIMDCSGKSCATGDNVGCHWHQDQPHFIKPAFVGPEAALEVVEAWYKVMGTATHHPFRAIQLREIERLVTADAFFVGINPADVLRKLDLKFDMDELVLLSGKTFEADQSIAQHYLGLLLKIKNKSSFKLNIELSQRRIRLNLWPHAFELLRPILSVFNKEGAHVRIYWTYSGPMYTLIQHELNTLIEKHESNWKKDVIAFLDTVSCPSYVETIPY
jgi:hypothetical protein